ncbi:MAG: rhodanese-like protein [Sediminibacterium sp.]|nr:rhodanese-like protein [Sediminibacterium sp.]
MRTRILLLFVSCILAQTVPAQFKYDNIAYKTVFINDLCDSLRNNPDRLILDVRSPGEFRDTSSQASLNIGHLKGAVNIDVREVKDRLAELQPYKNKPIFVICSHSQRSRVCSKMLADSGFTNVINVNGAMTEFNLLKNTSIPCVNDLYETSNPFKLLSPRDVARFLSSNQNVFILDVRSDSAFRGISTDVSANAQGRLKGSVNIPLAMLPSQLGKVPKQRPILVVADFGRETNLGAKLLTDKGYQNVHAAFNGLGEWMNASEEELPQRNRLWEQPNQFKLMTAVEMDKMLTADPTTYILDVRTQKEFTNVVTDKPWQNRGHVLNAVNIPAAELASRLGELSGYKDKTIILYAFGSNAEAFESAKLLADKGFTNIHLLTGGIWSIRGKAANQKGLSRLMKWVVDIPADNL